MFCVLLHFVSNGGKTIAYRDNMEVITMQIVRNQKISTKILSIAVVIVMLFSLVPIQAIAYSGEYDVISVPNVDIYTEFPEIGEQLNEGEYISRAIVPLNSVAVGSWDALRAAVNDITVTEIIITNSFEAVGSANSNAITIPAGRNITLMGNGAILTQTTIGQRHFLVNGTLSIEGVVLSGNFPTVTINHGGVQVNAGGSLYMEDGSGIKRNRNTGNASASAVLVSGADATFTMNGGEISDNSTLSVTATSSSGSATVFVIDGAVFTMNDGLIRNNTGRFGGAVRIGQTAAIGGNNRMYMNSGEIYNNTAFFGGGVNLEFGTVTMTGGTIRDNTATALQNNTTLPITDGRGGGGVFIQNSGIFNMAGGTISGNHSYTHGGGVMSGTPAANQFNMIGGTISGNTADFTGGGVRMSNGIFTMSSATLEDGTVTTGTITGNTAIYGGGIWLGPGTATANARLNMTAGTISNNTATYGDGGGIFTVDHGGYSDPLIMNSYRNIIAATGNFFGNTAGGGQFAPPSNANTRPFGHLLTNYNINYRGIFEVATVTFNLNSGNVDGNEADIVFTMPVGEPIGESNVPVPVRVYYTFEGWKYVGQTGPYNLSNEFVAEFDVFGSITFIAQWARVVYTVTFEPGAHGNLEGGTPNVTIQVPHGSNILAAQIPVVNADDGWVHDGWAYANPEGFTVTGSVTFTATYTKDLHNLIFDLNGGNVGGNTANIEYTLQQGTAVGADNVPAPIREHYKFDGWRYIGQEVGTPNLTSTDVANHIIDGTIIFIAQWTRIEHTVTFNLNSGNVNGSVVNVVYSVYEGDMIGIDRVPLPVRDGFSFAGWKLYGTGYIFSTIQVSEIVVYENMAFIAQWVRQGGGSGGQGRPPSGGDNGTPLPPSFTEEHIAYIAGYPDGTFRPAQSITRAEISMILFRLIDDAAKHSPQRNHFSDVNSGAWYAQAVNYLASYNILEGYHDGTFRPNAHITRAELAAVMSRFFEMDNSVVGGFSDVTNSHWAFLYINNAYNKGWIIGYADGTFRPNNAITRAETVTLINRVLNRVPNPATIEYHLAGIRIFTDITPAHWAFYEVMEASVLHEFEIDDNGLEIWTEVLSFPAQY